MYTRQRIVQLFPCTSPSSGIAGILRPACRVPYQGRRNPAIARCKSTTPPSFPAKASTTAAAAAAAASASSCHGAASQTRAFSATATYHKKGGKAAREAAAASSGSGSGSNSGASASGSEDPSDFSALESEISKCIERLRADLSKLRSGGRFNPEVLESLRVQLGGKGGGSAASSSSMVKLGDIAQVIPKGRTVQVLVGEIEHLKPTASAIQASALSLTPQPDPTGANPLLLVLTIPPPTADSRKAAVAAATKAGDAAGNAVRNARQTQQKRLRAMQLAKSARPDDLKKAGVAMEKVVEKGVGEVKRIVDGARKVLES